MKGITVSNSYEIANKTYAINHNFPLPEGPILPLNQYVVKGNQKSILLDTGANAVVGETIEALSRVINPQDLDYIFLTHMDLDHVGGLHEILKLAPKARVVGNVTVMGKGFSLYGIDPTRFAAVFPGQEIDLGGRAIRVEESLLEDGHTSWLFDTATRTFFTSDGFGSLQFGQPLPFADLVQPNAYAQGFAMWQAMNFHMLPRLDITKFREMIDYMRRLDVQQIASVHGPVVRQDLMQVFDLMEGMPGAEMPEHPPLPPMFQL
jgi:flavorubredoxin